MSSNISEATTTTKARIIGTKAHKQTMPKLLTQKQIKFVKNIIKGRTQADALILAGYSNKGVPKVTANKLIHTPTIRQALTRAGVTDESLAGVVKHHIQAGLNVKNTAETSLRAIEIALKLRGDLNAPESLTQNNIVINDLRGKSNEELRARLEELQSSIDG
jgi:hypothetical protein